MNVPGARHGSVALRFGHELLNYLDKHDLGRAMSNDTGIVTHRDPDSVRGADVSYYSYHRLPKDAEVPEGYPDVAPEIVIEVLSPDDRPKDVLAKLAEYLQVGVLVVCVVDPQRRCVTLYYPDRPEETLAEDAELSFAEILPGFSLPVGRLFS